MMANWNRLDGYDAILHAIDSNNYDLVQNLFQNSIDRIGNREHVEGSHLHYACANGKINSAAAMIDLGADIHSRNGFWDDTPLEAACVKSRYSIVEFLLERGSKIDTSFSWTNPLFACLGSFMHWNRHHAIAAGYSGRTEARANMVKTAELLIERGTDLTVCYIQRSMVDMDVSAFSYYVGIPEIAQSVVRILYGHDERLMAAAHAEAFEVAYWNGRSREKFRRRRYPPRRGKNANWRPDPGEFWT